MRWHVQTSPLTRAVDKPVTGNHALKLALFLTI